MKVAATPLLRFLLLYALFYAAFGVISPFFSPMLAAHGLSPSGIGLVMAASTAIRLVSGPVIGRFSDHAVLHRPVLAGCAILAAAAALAYLPAEGFAVVFLVVLLHAALLAPLVPLSDALALTASSREARDAEPGAGRRLGAFEYGWVRAMGSAAFVLAAVGAGYAIDERGYDMAIFLSAGLLIVAAACTLLVPGIGRTDPVLLARRRVRSTEAAGFEAIGFRGLLRLPRFGWMMLVAALVQSSAAIHDSFAALLWSSTGISPRVIGWLWGGAVLGEVVVFLLIGPWLLRRIGPGGASALAACASMLRWGVLGSSTSLPLIALVEPLHGFTFALQHLACMRFLADVVPSRLAAMAQAFYGTVAVGGATVLVNLAGGPLYAQFGAGAFWWMAGLCALALPGCAMIRKG